MSVQEIHLGHLAGLDAVDDVDVGLHRLVGVLGKDTVVLHPVTTSCRNPLNEIRSLRRLIAYSILNDAVLRISLSLPL